MQIQKIKIALVIQRFGREINGGAEVHCQQIAKHLSKNFQIEVLTSCAKDYRTWEPVYEAKNYSEGEYTIKRFSNERVGTKAQLRNIRKKITGRLWYQYLFRWLSLYEFLIKAFPTLAVTTLDNEQWLKYQGPYCPSLIDFLETNKDDYGVIIFFTSLYYPSAMGVLRFPEKAILIPMVHNEKANYYPIYHKVMNSPTWIFYNTLSEKLFSEKLYGNGNRCNAIVGLGIELPKLPIDHSVLEKFNIKKPYVLYVGRIEKGKGCKELIEYFLRFNKSNKDACQLVMVGMDLMKMKIVNSIICTGFVSEYDKQQLMQQCEVILIPSKFESLSLVLLEGFYLKKPALVNAKCKVLEEHIEQSRGGFVYRNYSEFAGYLNQFMKNNRIKEEAGLRGKKYVTNNYNWDVVIKKYENSINQIIHSKLKT